MPIVVQNYAKLSAKARKKPAESPRFRPTAGELKLTDTVLNLTYILGAGAIVAIIAGEIISGILNKKA